MKIYLLERTVDIKAVYASPLTVLKSLALPLICCSSKKNIVPAGGSSCATFLIISETDSLSLEAMWKYLLVCSVGIGLAFIGTIIVVAAGREVSSSEAVYTFTSLSSHAKELNPELMLFAFIFIVAGYGTKAGLAPMHTWLPDAHSQSPTPVSAVFSCVMLNTALFVIMRYLPLVDTSMGGGRAAHSILLLLGFLSLLFSAVFIPVVHP